MGGGEDRAMTHDSASFLLQEHPYVNAFFYMQPVMHGVDQSAVGVLRRVLVFFFATSITSNIYPHIPTKA